MNFEEIGKFSVFLQCRAKLGSAAYVDFPETDRRIGDPQQDFTGISLDSFEHQMPAAPEAWKSSFKILS